MPRFTNHHYLELHRRLRALWLQDDANYLDFTTTEQLTIHRFFAPGKDLDDEALLARRQEITKLEPSLPQRAGRAIANLDQIERIAAYRQNRAEELARNPPQPRPKGQRVTRPKGSEYNITVRGVMRPEIDIQRLACAIVHMAMDKAEKEVAAQKKRKRRLKDSD
ncbi:hypothetical protein BKA23_1420 [Rudaeicoccus suwonensis]|uniref:Uncharacterized protein n=2 Tax=Rudaeicoccus suwonensis TaxID=657409 RepID=A0A561EAG7_9MICO|nr:hypothetical protein BKA23_1420 [Rudaeicoccus suwonensis]